MVNPSIIPFNLHEMHLERLSKKVKFALIDRRNATREQVPIGHFTITLPRNEILCQIFWGLR